MCVCTLAQIDTVGITPLSLSPPALKDKAERADLQPDVWVGLTTGAYLGEEKRQKLKI